MTIDVSVSAPAPLAPFPNERAKGTNLIKQPVPIGHLLPTERYPQNASPAKLFESLTIRGVEFGNRAWVSPMCQYSSDNGKATDWHLVHLGSMSTRGWGSVMVEASAVVPEGRITPEDSGIWSDDHIPGFKRIADFVHGQGGLIGIQLAHAGRKASTLAPWVERIARDEGWEGGSTATEENGGWPNGVMAPTSISYEEGNFPQPVEASAEYLKDLKKAYLDAVKRCKVIGFDFIEIHGAHGYFFHEFASPLTNKRTDSYGGSLENRLRLPLEVTKSIREAWDKPLFYRVSASDWLEKVIGPEKSSPGQTEEWGWWGIEQTTIFAEKLRDLGVDLLDVSSGGNDSRQQIDVGPKYQVPFAAHVKKHVKNLLIGAVGLITTPEEAEGILQDGEADVVFLARQILRGIDFPLEAALQLGVAAAPAVQYERAWTRMLTKKDAVDHKKQVPAQVEGEENRPSHHKDESPPK